MIQAFQKFKYSGYLLLLLLLAVSCNMHHNDVELRQIRNVVADVSTDPLLRAEAVLYNPNNQKARLTSIDVDVFLNEKKTARVDQKMNVKIPSNGEFMVPIEAKLHLKETGLLNTLLGAFGSKKFKVRYKGTITVKFHGLPVRIAVDKEEMVKFSL